MQLFLEEHSGVKLMEKSSGHFEFESRGQWRAWLEQNHNTEAEAWLILFKKKYRAHQMAQDEAIEEALCFGWIDGTLKSLDKKRYVLRFSPRTRRSIWSVSNIQRVEKLLTDGKMTEAGRKKIVEAKENGEWEAAIQREQVDVIPDELERRLCKEEGALTAYNNLPDSKKKQYIYWLQSAKKEKTKQGRIEKIIDEVLSK